MKFHLERGLARAEAVVHEADTSSLKRHTPTIDNFRGQILAYKQALTLLEIEKITQPGPIKIHRSYTLTIPWVVVALGLLGVILVLS